MAKVNHRVSNLAVTRDGYDIKAEWRVPPEMTDPDNPRRATWIDIYCDFDVTGKRKQSARVGVGQSDGSTPPVSYKHSDRFWIRGQNTGDSVTKNFDRTRWHPCTWKGTDGTKNVSNVGTYCKNVKVGVFGGNGSSIKNAGQTVWATYTFKEPRKPTVKWTYEAGNATVTVETDPGDDNYERYDTMVRVTVKKMNGTQFVVLDSNYKGWFSTKSTKWTKTFDISSLISGLVPGKCVTVKCEAYARGMAGNSAPVSSERVVALPSAATIDSVTADKKSTGGRIKVAVTPHGYNSAIQLLRKHGADGTEEEVAGAVDDNQCKALYDDWATASPNSGQYLYYAVRSTRDGYSAMSAWKRADSLYTAASKPECNAKTGIPEVRPTANGTGATVVMAFTDVTANTGCELSYSDYGKAWSSSDSSAVTRVEYTGRDDPKDAAATGYENSRAVLVTGLTSGTTYYCRMRRYRVIGESKYYSAYTDVKTFVTESAAGDKCGFMSITPGDDGTTAKLVIGINETGTNTGTEVSWSADANAWWSNEQPQTVNATWSPTAITGQSWGKSQTVYLRGLEPGTAYTVRARRYQEIGGNTTYGSYGNGTFSTPSLESSRDLRCGLVSVEPGEDGRSAVVVVGWSGDRDGTEVSWSTDPNAWESSEPPSTGEFTWRDSETRADTRYERTGDVAPVEGKTYYFEGRDANGKPIMLPEQNPVSSAMASYYEAFPAWAYTGTYYIRGLDEGVTCYVRARTFAEAGERAYSGITEAIPVTPFAAPDSVSVTAPEAVARGESIELWWTVQSDMEQAEWHVHESSSPNTSLADGTGTLCRASIGPERYGDAASLVMYVESGCGGGLTASAPFTVAIADAPSCEVYAEPVLDVQPMSFDVYTGESTSRLLCTVRSLGCTHDLPDGAHDQLEGDVAWTEAISPALVSTTWGETDLYDSLVQAESDTADALADAQDELDGYEEGDEGYEDALVAVENAEAAHDAAVAARAAHPAAGETMAAEIEVPTVDLLDGGAYVLQVSAVESVAGLESPIAEMRFAVAYEHQAPDPDAELTPDAAARTVEIALNEPDGYEDGDLYDVYRKTPTGYELAARGIEPEKVLVDNFAPFGGESLAYAICCRTTDGDTSYREFPYELDVHVLRFDWDGGSVELPHNIQLRDSYVKSFESRAHADGSVGGYYDRSVEMTGSYSSDAAKVEDPEAVRMLREMADHPGACFCRTPEGDAFQCNVDVSEIGGKVDAIAAVSLDVTRVRLTEPFGIGDDISGREVSNG